MKSIRSVLRLALLAVSSSLLAVVPAHAAQTVIDFEGVVASGGTSTCPTTPYTENGYTLTVSPAAQCNNFISNNVGSNNSYGNTSSVFGICAYCGETFTLTGTSSFSIASIDLGSHYGSDPDVLIFTGFFSGGGSITQSINATQRWATYNLAGFTGLSSLQFAFAAGNSSNNHASLDNLVLYVPEPTGLALVGLGLVALGATSLRRRRTPKAA